MDRLVFDTSSSRPHDHNFVDEPKQDKPSLLMRAVVVAFSSGISQIRNTNSFAVALADFIKKEDFEKNTEATKKLLLEELKQKKKQIRKSTHKPFYKEPKSEETISAFDDLCQANHVSLTALRSLANSGSLGNLPPSFVIDYETREEYARPKGLPVSACVTSLEGLRALAAQMNKPGLPSTVGADAQYAVSLSGDGAILGVISQDADGTNHPVGAAIVASENKEQVAQVFTVLKEGAEIVSGHPVDIDFAILDGHAALHGGARAALPHIDTLMCNFHYLRTVKGTSEETKKLRADLVVYGGLACDVMASVYLICVKQVHGKNQVGRKWMATFEHNESHRPELCLFSTSDAPAGLPRAVD